MTYQQRIEMYRRKKAFIDNINKAFELSETTVESVKYEVLTKTVDLPNEPSRSVYYEFVIVEFTGGAKSIRNVNGNSDNANFRAIGRLLDGGYYGEVEDYKSMLDSGFTKVNL